MSSNRILVQSDHYDKDELVSLIKFCNEDMASHVNEIRKLNQIMIQWLHRPETHKYIISRINLEYDAYCQTQEQLQFYKSELKDEYNIEA